MMPFSVGTIVTSVVSLVLGSFFTYVFDRVKERRIRKSHRPFISERRGDNVNFSNLHDAEICLAEGMFLVNPEGQKTGIEYRIKRCNNYKSYLEEQYHFIWIEATYRKITIQSFAEPNKINQRIRIMQSELLCVEKSMSKTALILVVHEELVPSVLEVVVEYDAEIKRRHSYRRESINNWASR